MKYSVNCTCLGSSDTIIFHGRPHQKFSAGLLSNANARVSEKQVV